LSIPRGGVVTGAVLARELEAELDVVLSRKLRAPHQPELAIGAVGEDGQVYMSRQGRLLAGVDEVYIASERSHQMQEIARRTKLFRAVKPPASLAERTVIITDDGIATGATMIAAIHVAKEQHPFEVVVAVPVAPPDRLQSIGRLCDRLICLEAPEEFFAVGQFYDSFETVEDEEVVRILREFAPARPSATHAR
jgi:predicted phosphoribosyltransferase